MEVTSPQLDRLASASLITMVDNIGHQCNCWLEIELGTTTRVACKGHAILIVQQVCAQDSKAYYCGMLKQKFQLQ